MTNRPDQRPIGLITAIPEELAHFGAHLAIEKEDSFAGLTFRIGTLDGISLVAVEAGLGKVNAALVATLLLERYDCRALVFSGVAGGVDPGFGVGDIVIGKQLICHDYGRMEGGRLVSYQPGDFPFPGMGGAPGYELPNDLCALIEDALAGFQRPLLSAEAVGGESRQIQLVMGRIATGDSFVACAKTRERLYQDFGVQAVEMEGAAIAQIAERFETPYLIVRALSDLAGDESHMDFDKFLGEVADLAAGVVRRLLPVL